MFVPSVTDAHRRERASPSPGLRTQLAHQPHNARFLRQTWPSIPITPRPNRVSEAGSGVAVAAGPPTCNVKKSASAPLPQVQVYVPGVTPMLAKVWPENVSVADRGAPDV
jgi:hypothetical protein